jgi:hypothetical protein
MKVAAWPLVTAPALAATAGARDHSAADAWFREGVEWSEASE